MKKILLLGLSFFWLNEAYSQNLVLDFSKKLKDSCPQSSRNLSKKLLIRIIKSNGYLDCDDELIQSRYFKKCSKEFSCKDGLSLYSEIKTKYSGNVIGGE